MIDEFMKTLYDNGGVFRPNRYRVEIDLPMKLQSKYQRQIESIGLSCIGTALPGSSIDSKESNRSLLIFNPHSSNYNSEDFRFYLGNKMLARRLFLDWMRLVIDHDTKTIGYHDDYVGQFRLYPMKRGNSEASNDALSLGEVILKEAYPETLGSVGVSYEEANTFAVQNVSIKFASKTEIYRDDGE